MSEAKKEGFDEVIYLDATNEEFIEEVGSANMFIFKDGEILTPPLSGSILGGVTRDSVCKVAKDILKIPLKEINISVQDLISADEIFCTGTVVVVLLSGNFLIKG